ncbi:MAG: alpha-glucan family phosphorylase [Candidatus Bathyarchaeota archaeon]
MEILESSKRKIAYFSMEVGLNNDIPTYSGGLGVLAGDTIKSSADLNIPIVAVTLVSKKGCFKQKITPEGNQIEYYYPWDPSRFSELLPTEAKVSIQNREVRIKAWLYNVHSLLGGVVPVIFLDTDVDGNTPEDKEITYCLYEGDATYRLKQEIILGIGGIRILESLGFNIKKYHMNEGHSSLLTLDLLSKQVNDPSKVREMCIFTTHTPVEAGHDNFSYELVKDLMNRYDLETLKKFGGYDRLNMTLLGFNLSGYINGVTTMHRHTSHAIFPGYMISAITNGIHSHTWTCTSFRKILDKHLSGWANEPELLVRADLIPNEEVWNAHTEAKKMLIDFVNKSTKKDINSETLTIGFARRMAGYKRANLLFSDLERLEKINKKGKIQIICAGKAHPSDESGKRMIKEIFSKIETLRGKIEAVYLEDYDLSLAYKLVSGVDVWLNTPLPPLEASGTSGMKAAHNGVINFSVLDGWWIEGWIEGVTGWAIGPHPNEAMSNEERIARELDDLYNKLEYCIVPMFYNNSDQWITLMKNSISKIAYYFNSHRMMRRYVTEAYL